MERTWELPKILSSGLRGFRHPSAELPRSFRKLPRTVRFQSGVRRSNEWFAQGSNMWI